MHHGQAICVEVPSASALEASSLDSSDFPEHHRPGRLLYLLDLMPGTGKGVPFGSQHLFHAALADDHEQAVSKPYQLATPISPLLPLESS
jgi:hypothetical protein